MRWLSRPRTSNEANSQAYQIFSWKSFGEHVPLNSDFTVILSKSRSWMSSIGVLSTSLTQTYLAAHTKKLLSHSLLFVFRPVPIFFLALEESRWIAPEHDRLPLRLSYIFLSENFSSRKFDDYTAHFRSFVLCSNTDFILRRHSITESVRPTLQQTLLSESR